MKILLGLLLSVATLFAVDINHANQKELTTLKGVGVKTAQNIIDYRTIKGCFSSIDALVNVKGIGAKTFEKNRAVLEAKKCK